MVNAEKHLRRLWRDTCAIDVTADADAPSGAKARRWTPLVRDEPCKLSYFNNVRLNPMPDARSMAAQTFQQAKLFLRRDLEVPAGSRVTVRLHGGADELFFENTGQPARFTHHQELLLQVSQRWA